MSLDEQGALLIADVTGWKRDLSHFMAIDCVFDTLVEALSQNPERLV